MAYLAAAPRRRQRCFSFHRGPTPWGIMEGRDYRNRLHGVYCRRCGVQWLKWQLIAERGLQLGPDPYFAKE